MYSRYGACFYPGGDYLLAARPGKRIWLAESITASVKQTLNFKDSLTMQPIFFEGIQKQNNSEVFNSNKIEETMKNAIFSQLVTVSDTLLLAWDSNTLFLIDLETVRIVEWHADLVNIQDVSIRHNAVYILHGGLANKPTNISKVTLPFSAPLPQMNSSEQRSTENIVTSEIQNCETDKKSGEEQVASPRPVLQPSLSTSSSKISVDVPMRNYLPPTETQQTVNTAAAPTTPPITNSPVLQTNFLDLTNQNFPQPETATAATVVSVAKKITRKKKRSKIPEILSPLSPTPLSSKIPDTSATDRSLSRSTSASSLGSQQALQPQQRINNTTASNNNFDMTQSSRHFNNRSAMDDNAALTMNELPLEDGSSVDSKVYQHSDWKAPNFVSSFKEKVATISTQINKMQIDDIHQQLRSFIKDPIMSGMNIASSKTEELISHRGSDLVDPSISNRSSYNNGTDASKHEENVLLSKRNMDILTGYRRDKSLPLSCVLDELQIWLQSFETDAAIASVIPSSWITELLTSYFEFRSSNNEGLVWTEKEAHDFLQKYVKFIHHPRVFFACNQARFSSNLEFFWDQEDKADEASSIGDSSPPTHQRQLDNLRSQVEKYLSAGNGVAALNTLKKHNNLILTLRYLKQLFRSAPKPTASYCVFSYPTILPWNVESCISIQEGLTTLLFYLTELMQQEQDCRRDSHLTELWFECNLADGAPALDELCLNKKTPRRNAHLQKWEHYGTLKIIIENTRNEYHYQTVHLKLLCEKYGFFPGLAILYRKSNQTRRAIDLILQMDDLASFTELMSENTELFDWKYLLSQLSSQQEQQDPPNNINIEIVTHMMLRCIGTAQSLELLQECSSPLLTQLPVSVFQECIRMAQIEREQELLTREMLEIYDAYLWSARPSGLAPQFRAVLEEELLAQSKGDANTDSSLRSIPFVTAHEVTPTSTGSASLLNNANSPLPTVRYELAFDYLSPVKRFYEERGVHWGSHMSNTHCPYCSLPLIPSPNDKVLLPGTMPPVSVLPCGHGAHPRCRAHDGFLKGERDTNEANFISGCELCSVQSLLATSSVLFPTSSVSN